MSRPADFSPTSGSRYMAILVHLHDSFNRIGEGMTSCTVRTGTVGDVM